MDQPAAAQLGGEDDSLEHMSEAGYSDYYAEDLSRRVDAQTRGIVDPDGEHPACAEQIASTKQPRVGGEEPEPASRAHKTGLPVDQSSPTSEGEGAARQPKGATEQPAEERKRAEPAGEVQRARSTSRSILKAPKTKASSPESRPTGRQLPAKSAKSVSIVVGSARGGRTSAGSAAPAKQRRPAGAAAREKVEKALQERKEMEAARLSTEGRQGTPRTREEAKGERAKAREERANERRLGRQPSLQGNTQVRPVAMAPEEGTPG